MAADPVLAPRPRAPQRPRLRPAPPPRRVSGPARSSTLAAAATAPRTRRTQAGTIALPAPSLPLHRLGEALRGLPDARWLDRLLRGQGWIVLIGIALMGIVAMQVSLLKMNAGIGQSIERAGSLERQNAALRAEVSQLSSEERIASVAAQNGLVMPDAGEVRYVTVRGEEDARKAASVMRAPDPVDELATRSTATTTATPTAVTTPTTDPTTSTAPVTPPADATVPVTPTEPTTTAPPADPGTTAGATEAPVGATAAPGQ